MNREDERRLESAGEPSTPTPRGSRTTPRPRTGLKEGARGKAKVESADCRGGERDTIKSKKSDNATAALRQKQTGQPGYGPCTERGRKREGHDPIYTAKPGKNHGRGHTGLKMKQNRESWQKETVTAPGEGRQGQKKEELDY